MHEFGVWAPSAQTMTLKLCRQGQPEQDLAMEGPSADGWWRVTTEAACGDDYGYMINGDRQAFPDPRSLDQPKGVHGLSRLYDHSLFQWHDSLWQGPPLTGAVAYELHIGTFTKEGTFDAAIERLEFLADLGITHVEIMPVAAFPGDFGWGYDGVSLFAVAQQYGGPNAFKRFVDAAHQCGLAVLLDVVYNHFGPVGNYTTKYGNYLTDVHHTPWGQAINFESKGSTEVRRFFCDNALMWMRDYHVDGLRLDAVHEFMDRSAIHFMEQLSNEVEVLSSLLGRRLVLIAESDLNNPQLVRPREANGFGLDAQWSDDFHHALFTVMSEQPAGFGYYDDFGDMADLAKALKEVFVYDGDYSQYRGRNHGRPVREVSAHRFVVFIQNHDQVGNRATGDRIEHIVGMERAKAGLAVVMLAPYVPMLFQGEEFAASTPFQYFAHHDDAEMAKAVSEGRKKEFASFGWDENEVPDPEKRETFENSKLNWDEVHTGKHQEMLDWTRALIHLRRTSSSLNDGDLQHLCVRFDEEKRWLEIVRGGVTLLVNFGAEAVRLKNQGHRPLELSSGGVAMEDDAVVLQPNGLAVLREPKI